MFGIGRSSVLGFSGQVFWDWSVKCFGILQLNITEQSFGNSEWYVEAINDDGNTMAYAYGETRDEAVDKVVNEVNSIYYNDVDINF